jgi:hypothetical protein
MYIYIQDLSIFCEWYARLYIHIYTYIYTHIYIYIYIYTHYTGFVSFLWIMCWFPYLYIHIYIYIYMYLYIHIYTGFVNFLLMICWGVIRYRGPHRTLWGAWTPMEPLLKGSSQVREALYVYINIYIDIYIHKYSNICTYYV